MQGLILDLRGNRGGLLRQAVFGRLAGCEDVNDADRLAHDPAMRAIVGRCSHRWKTGPVHRLKAEPPA